MLAGCGGCLLLVVLLFAAIGGGVFYATRGPVEAVRAQLAEIRGGRLDAAYDHYLSASYRARVSREQFAELIARHPALKSNADSTFTSRHIENDTARVSGSLTGSGGEKEPVAYGLVKEGGGWKIASIRFEMEEGEGP
jgi:hypothetical protein